MANTCLERARAAALVLGQLPPLEAVSIRRHLEQCKTCEALVSAIEGQLAGETASDSLDLLPLTQRVDRYVVLSELGRGGMGQVFSAYDPKLNRRVALKVLLRGLDDAQLLREAQALAQLSHPNVVQVFDAGVHAERVYVAMELLEGSSLRTWLRSGPRPWREILRRFLEAGEGLSAAHRAGLIHRDFKPANVVCSPTGAKVLDFGIAQAISAGRPDAEQRGKVMGTPAYMAPEQRRAEPSDVRTDVYGFCASAYEALASVRWPAPPPAGNQTPPWVLDLLRKGLEAEPAARWQSMRALLNALSKDPAKRLKRAGAVLAAVVAVLALSAGQYQWAESRKARCSGAVERDSVWSEARRQAVIASALPTVRPLAEAAASRLDQWAESWRARYQLSCEASQLRNELPEASFQLQASCLFRARGQTAELLKQARLDSPEEAARFVRSLDDLFELSTCDDLAALAVLAQGEPAAKAEVIKEVRHRLDSVMASSVLGQTSRARTDGADLVAEAESTGVKSLQAEVFTVMGQLAPNREARWQLQTRAYEAAVAAGSMATAARISIELAGLVPADNLPLLTLVERTAEGQCARVGWTTHRRALLAEKLGNAAYDRGDYALAEKKAAEIIELREAEGALKSPSGITGLAHRASALYMLGRLSESVPLQERAVTLLTELYGPTAIRTLVERGNLGMHLVEAGQAERALEQLEPSMAQLEAQVGPQAPELSAHLDALASTYEAMGRFDDARPLRSRLVDMVVAEEGPHSASAAHARGNLGGVVFELGDDALARKLVEASLADFTLSDGTLHPDAVDSLVTLSLIESRQKARGACNTLDRVLPLQAVAKGTPAQHARAAFARASCTPSDDLEAQARWALEAQRQSSAIGRTWEAARVQRWIDARPKLKEHILRSARPAQ